MALNRERARIRRKKKRLATDEPAISHADQIVLVFNLPPKRIVDIGLDLDSLFHLSHPSGQEIATVPPRPGSSLRSAKRVPPPRSAARGSKLRLAATIMRS